MTFLALLSIIMSLQEYGCCIFTRSRAKTTGQSEYQEQETDNGKIRKEEDKKEGRKRRRRKKRRVRRKKKKEEEAGGGVEEE